MAWLLSDFAMASLAAGLPDPWSLRVRAVSQRSGGRRPASLRRRGLRPLRRPARAPRRRAGAARRARRHRIAVRAHRGRGAAAYDAALWTAMVEQGWLGDRGRRGRAAASASATVEVAVLLEELGRHAAPAPFASTVLAIDALARRPNRAADRLLADGGIACVAWSRRPARSRRAAADGWRSPAARPDAVRAVGRRRGRRRERPTATACSRWTSTRTGRPPREPAMDLTRELGWLAFDADAAPTQLGGADAVARARSTAARRSRPRSCSAARRARSTWRSSTPRTACSSAARSASFQAVKHRCADMLVDVEGMRSTVYWAAWCIGAGRSRRVGRGVDREDLVLRRVEAGDGVGAPGARRHRLHVGARPALLHEARAARPAHVRRRRLPSRAARPLAATTGRGRGEHHLTRGSASRGAGSERGAVGLAGGRAPGARRRPRPARAS